jgi:hypothetical protein
MWIFEPGSRVVESRRPAHGKTLSRPDVFIHFTEVRQYGQRGIAISEAALPHLVVWQMISRHLVGAYRLPNHEPAPAQMHWSAAAEPAVHNPSAYGLGLRTKIYQAT